MSEASRSSLGGGNSQNLGGIHETETQRLQREVDTYTQALEHERHRLLTIDQQIKQVEQELKEKQESNTMKKPTYKVERQENLDLKHQKNQVKNERLRLNQTKAQNKTHRAKIDSLRKELLNATNECNTLTSETKRIKKEAQEQNKLQLISNQLAEQHTNQCIALRAKHEEDKEAFENKIKSMRETLTQKDDMPAFESDKANEKQATDKKQSVGDFSNHINVLRLRLAKIIATNKGKKRLMDQYVRNVSAMKDAFDQIKEATGISSIEETVTSFIKAEEQNYSLFNYVNMLTTETDQLEESNREIKDQIDRIIQRGKMNDEDRENQRSQMESECNNLLEQINKANAETEAARRMFRKVQQHVEMMVEMFKRSKFYLSVATRMNYDEGFIFSESNIVSFLAELEEYICSLITYTAFKRDDPQAAISAIPLEKLFAKDFQRKDITIAVPSNFPQADIDIVDPQYLAQDGQLPDEEMQHTNPAELYNNFRKLLKDKPSGSQPVQKIQDDQQ